MSNLIIPQTNKTPNIEFNLNGEFSITGKSLPEDAKLFYEPAIRWIDDLKSNYCPPVIHFKIKLEYFNTASSKMLISIFKKLEELKKFSSEITIFWYYDEDDEDTKEAGEDFDSIIKIPFKQIMVL